MSTQDVPLQILLGRGKVSAVRAAERPLSRVRTDVDDDVRRLVRTMAAEPAEVHQAPPTGHVRVPLPYLDDAVSPHGHVFQLATHEGPVARYMITKRSELHSVRYAVEHTTNVHVPKGTGDTDPHDCCKRKALAQVCISSYGIHST